MPDTIATLPGLPPGAHWVRFEFPGRVGPWFSASPSLHPSPHRVSGTPQPGDRVCTSDGLGNAVYTPTTDTP